MAGRRFDLTGRISVVTGAASGLGRAIAIGLAEYGSAVAVADMNAAGAEEVARIITDAGGRALAIECDVSSERAVALAFERTSSELGPLNVLVNNVGAAHVRAKPEDYPLDAWQQGISTNLTGAFLCSREAGRIMIAEGGGGSIINISSVVGSSGFGRGLLVYPVSKSGLNQLTRELAVEWGQHGIRVNAIQPCQMRTPAFQRQLADPRVDAEALQTRFLSGIPLNRFGEPNDVVGPVIFLASDAASMVTGVMLPVDGGNLALNASGFPTW